MNILSGADTDSHYQAGPDPGHIGSSQVSRGGWLKAFLGVGTLPPCGGFTGEPNLSFKTFAQPTLDRKDEFCKI